MRAPTARQGAVRTEAVGYASGMPPLPDEMLVPMIGVMVGLVVFAGLLQFGVWIVRRLGLPNDLPEGPHFEPPPPPARDVLDRAEARRIVDQQVSMRQRYALARATAQAAQRCAELAAQDYGKVEGAPDPITVKTDMRRLTDSAKRAAVAADRAARNPDQSVTNAECEALARSAVAAAQEAEALAARFPSGRERRLRIMAVILVIAVIWSALMFYIRFHH